MQEKAPQINVLKNENFLNQHMFCASDTIYLLLYFYYLFTIILLLFIYYYTISDTIILLRFFLVQNFHCSLL